MLSRVRSLARVLRHRVEFEDGMAEEMRFHIEQYTDELVRSGVPPEEAARRARMEFGSVDDVQEECREARGLRPFDELLRQLRHAAAAAAQDARLHSDRPADARALPRRESHDLRRRRLPSCSARCRFPTPAGWSPSSTLTRKPASTATAPRSRTTTSAAAGSPLSPRLAIYRYGTAIVGETGATEREPIARVSPDFFSTLGARPGDGTQLHGGGNHVSDRQGGHSHRRLLAAALQRRSPRDRPADPRGRLPDTVVGVLPPGLPLSLFRGAAVLSALRRRPEDRASRAAAFGRELQAMIARLRPGRHSSRRRRRRSMRRMRRWKRTIPRPK